MKVAMVLNKETKQTSLPHNPVGWGHEICICNLAEVPVLEPGEVWSIPSLPLHLALLCPRVVVPVKMPSIGQIKLFNHLLFLKPFNKVQTNNVE